MECWYPGCTSNKCQVVKKGCPSDACANLTLSTYFRDSEVLLSGLRVFNAEAPISPFFRCCAKLPYPQETVTGTRAIVNMKSNADVLALRDLYQADLVMQFVLRFSEPVTGRG